MLNVILEILIRILAWAVQIAAAALAAAILTATVVWGAETLIRRKRGRFMPRFLIVLLLVCAVLTCLALHPPVICPERYERYLTPERLEAVRSGGAGIYSWNIPLVPVCIKVTDVHNFVVEEQMEYRIDFTVYYFCMGSMRMEYSTRDGYNSYPMFGS